MQDVVNKPQMQPNGQQIPIQGQQDVASVHQEMQPVIGKKEIAKAMQTLKKYKEGKNNLEQRIVNNEKWYRMRHWELLRSEENENDPKPASGWLFNCIMSKHADFMDAYPEPNVLPREEADKKEAKILSSIIPVILEQNQFEQTYSDASWYKLKNGTGCYGVFWNKDKLNGLGDIDIQQVDLLNLFWEPGIKKLQKSRNLFYVDLVDNDILEGKYPELKGKLKTDTSDLKQYVHDDHISTEGKSLVVDWYYHKHNGSKKVLHYCKFCGEEVLYASENDPEMQEGWYKHGKYPFVFDVLFKEEGLPTGFGYVDVCKEAQESIDRLNNDIEVNARWGARPRFLLREDGDINEDELNDLSKQIIHVSGNLGEDTIKRIETEHLDSVYLNILQSKIEELKETSGNRDVNNGGTTSGATAASAIAAMQEQSGKTSRDSIQGSYRSYTGVIELVIELIRQFYNMPRTFRIIGEKGQEEFISYTNEGMQLVPQGIAFGQDMGYRLPVFDIKVSAQKANPYSKLSQNELAIQFYNQGFFNPQMVDQALACLDMMDFNGKDEVIQKVTKNGGMYMQMIQMQQQMLQMAQIIDKLQGTNLAEGLAAGITGNTSVPTGTGSAEIAQTGNLGELKTPEHKVVADAREQANNATTPR